MADPLRLRTGESYDSGIQRWPGQELILTTEGCVLLVDYISPTPEQIDEFQTADAHFAWVDGRHNGILCFRFGGSPWNGISFNPHRDTPPEKIPGMPVVAPGRYLDVAVGLADSESPVLAVRMVKRPEHFVSAVGATVTRLAAQSFNADGTVNERNSLYVFVVAERLVQRAGVRSASALTHQL
jgi:hypothetical protein